MSAPQNIPPAQTTATAGKAQPAKKPRPPPAERTITELIAGRSTPKKRVTFPKGDSRAPETPLQPASSQGHKEKGSPIPIDTSRANDHTSQGAASARWIGNTVSGVTGFFSRLTSPAPQGTPKTKGTHKATSGEQSRYRATVEDDVEAEDYVPQTKGYEEDQGPAAEDYEEDQGPAAEDYDLPPHKQAHNHPYRQHQEPQESSPRGPDSDQLMGLVRDVHDSEDAYNETVRRERELARRKREELAKREKDPQWKGKAREQDDLDTGESSTQAHNPAPSEAWPPDDPREEPRDRGYYMEGDPDDDPDGPDPAYDHRGPRGDPDGDPDGPDPAYDHRSPRGDPDGDPDDDPDDDTDDDPDDNPRGDRRGDPRGDPHGYPDDDPDNEPEDDDLRTDDEDNYQSNLRWDELYVWDDELQRPVKKRIYQYLYKRTVKHDRTRNVFKQGYFLTISQGRNSDYPRALLYELTPAHKLWGRGALDRFINRGGQPMQIGTEEELLGKIFQERTLCGVTHVPMTKENPLRNPDTYLKYYWDGSPKKWYSVKLVTKYFGSDEARKDIQIASHKAGKPNPIIMPEREEKRKIWKEALDRRAQEADWMQRDRLSDYDRRQDGSDDDSPDDYRREGRPNRSRNRPGYANRPQDRSGYGDRRRRADSPEPGYDNRRQDRSGYGDRRRRADSPEPGYDNRRQDRSGYGDRRRRADSPQPGYDNRRQDRSGYGDRRRRADSPQEQDYDDRRQDRSGNGDRRRRADSPQRQGHSDSRRNQADNRQRNHSPDIPIRQRQDDEYRRRDGPDSPQTWRTPPPVYRSRSRTVTPRDRLYRPNSPPVTPARGQGQRSRRAPSPLPSPNSMLGQNGSRQGPSPQQRGLRRQDDYGQAGPSQSTNTRRQDNHGQAGPSQSTNTRRQDNYGQAGPRKAGPSQSTSRQTQGDGWTGLRTYRHGEEDRY
jgi:hypothetical protein